MDFVFLMFLKKKTGNFIGDAGLIHEALNPKNSNIEVGYRLHQKYWNKGYATELATAFIAWGFNKFHLNQIVAFCKEGNVRSSHVMKKCGLTYDGKHLYNQQVACDMYRIKKIP